MCIWRRGVLFGRGGGGIFYLFVWGFFFFCVFLEFGLGVGKTGLSGLSPSPLVRAAGERGGGERLLKASALDSPRSF